MIKYKIYLSYLLLVKKKGKIKHKQLFAHDFTLKGIFAAVKSSISISLSKLKRVA